jgi:Uncharacterized protein conserved in archaea
MLDSFVEKVKGFILNPGETFQKSKADDMETSLPYFAILVLINAILSAIIAAILPLPQYTGMAGGVSLPILVFFIVLVAEFIFTLVFGAWLHLWVYLVGGRKGIWETMKAVIYGSTPSLLLGWIPVISILFALWSVVLWTLGVRDLQELSTGKAIVAVAIAILIPLAIILILAAYLLTSYVTMTPVPSVSPAL